MTKLTEQDLNTPEMLFYNKLVGEEDSWNVVTGIDADGQHQTAERSDVVNIESDQVLFRSPVGDKQLHTLTSPQFIEHIYKYGKRPIELPKYGISPCAKCGEDITGQAVYTQGQHYHKDCFDTEQLNTPPEYFTARGGFYR